MTFKVGDVVRCLHGSRSLNVIARVSDGGSGDFWSESAGPFRQGDFERYVSERELVEREASIQVFVRRMRTAVDQMHEGLAAVGEELDLLEHPSN